MYIQNVPPVFYNYSPLTHKIKQLTEIGYTLDDLTFLHKNELIALVMDALKEDQSYALFDTDEFTENCDHFKNYLKTRSLSHLYKFTTSLENSAFDKYHDIIFSIFNHFKEGRKSA